MMFRLLCALCLAGVGIPWTARAEDEGATVRVAGASALRRVLVDAGKLLASEKKVAIRVVGEGNSNIGVAAVGQRLADIGLLTRRLTAQDRADHPDTDFREFHIGEQVVAFVVARDVWEGGVRDISAGQARELYRRRLTNWKELGGADSRITFFLSEEGKGWFELFALWAFGSTQRVPLGRFQTVADNDEARNSVEFTASAAALMPPTWANRASSYPLAVKDEAGTVVEPTSENIRDGKWPMSRPLILVVRGRPVREIRAVIDFLLGPSGEEILHANGYLPAAQIGVRNDLD